MLYYVKNYFRLIIGIFVFSRETLRVVFGAAYSARMTMVKYQRCQITEVPNSRGAREQKVEKNSSSSKRWPESLFQKSIPLLFQNFSIRSGYSSNLRIRLQFRLRLQSSFQP